MAEHMIVRSWARRSNCAWVSCGLNRGYPLRLPRQLVWCGVVWCGVVWCGVVWCGVVWCGVVWCGVVWCGVSWCGVVWCGVVWCGVVWCGVVWCGVVWCGVVWCGVVWCGARALPRGPASSNLDTQLRPPPDPPKFWNRSFSKLRFWGKLWAPQARDLL